MGIILLSASASRFVDFFGMAPFFLFATFFNLFTPESEPSESEVYFTGPFVRPDRRVDMLKSEVYRLRLWALQEIDQL